MSMINIIYSLLLFKIGVLYLVALQEVFSNQAVKITNIVKNIFPEHYCYYATILNQVDDLFFW